MASSIDKFSKSPVDNKGATSSRGTGQTAKMPASEATRKRAVRRGANIHIQDEDQAPTGKNAGDARAAEAEVAASKRHASRRARTVAGGDG